MSETKKTLDRARPWHANTEARELKRAAQDITLFLRLAALRIENRPDALPFVAHTGHLAIGWLRALAERYGNGEDIST